MKIKKETINKTIDLICENIGYKPNYEHGDSGIIVIGVDYGSKVWELRDTEYLSTAEHIGNINGIKIVVPSGNTHDIYIAIMIIQEVLKPYFDRKEE